MLFTKPIKFDEALKARKVKKLLPTTASSARLAALEPHIRERSMFMARVNHIGMVGQTHSKIGQVLGIDDQQSSMINPDTARAELKQYLSSIGYDPENPPEGFEPAKPGSIQDLSSDGRLNLVLDTNLKMAHGYGQFEKANDPDILDAFPCWELYRLENRKKERGWLRIWAVDNGGGLYGPKKDRMIARKDDPVWTAISAFGTPYPPFDYNSGMWVEEIDREEAEALGVIKSSTVVVPQERNFNTDVSGAVPSGLSEALLSAVSSVLKVEGERFVI